MIKEIDMCNGGVYDDGNNFYPCESRATRWFIYPSGKPCGRCEFCDDPMFGKKVSYEEAVVAYFMIS
jgi:hypothetical protein